MFRTSMAAIVCVLAFSSTTSWAAANSSASISGITFTLIDLDPQDGIAPSFSFLTRGGSTDVLMYVSNGVAGDKEEVSSSRAGTFTASKQYLAEVAKANAQSSAVGQSLFASGSAAGAQTYYSAFVSAGSVGVGLFNLSLSANSQLMIKANVDLSASAFNAVPNCYFGDCFTEGSEASASMYMLYSYDVNGASVSNRTLKDASLSATARGADPFGQEEVYNPETGNYEVRSFVIPAHDEYKHRSDTLNGIFTNSSDTTQVANFAIAVSARGWSTGSPSSVPEASTWGMLIAGALVLGMAKRSRG